MFQKQVNGTTLIANGMFQKQAYVITWYQQVCSKYKSMALPLHQPAQINGSQSVKDILHYMKLKCCTVPCDQTYFLRF